MADESIDQDLAAGTGGSAVVIEVDLRVGHRGQRQAILADQLVGAEQPHVGAAEQGQVDVDLAPEQGQAWAAPPRRRPRARTWPAGR